MSKTKARFPRFLRVGCEFRKACVLACVSLCLPAFLPLPSAAADTRGDARLTYSELHYYESAKPITGWPAAELLHSNLGLKGLKPARSQAALPVILQKTGEKVAAFFSNFTNTESVETIVAERLNPGTGGVHFGNSGEEKFNYLFLALPGSRHRGLQEYRTNAKGERVEPHPLLSGTSFVTEGFASLPDFFLPSYQPESTFRYLGRQRMDKRPTVVVAFAQRPQTARLIGGFRFGNESASLLLQGLAWIELPDYQIIRLRTDLLAPRADVGLNRETTDIRFKDIRFKQNDTTLWLPVDVVVSVEWQDEMFQNHHHYSHFRLFQVNTQLQKGKRASVKKKH